MNRIGMEVSMVFTKKQKLVLRMLSLTPGGASMAYVVYVLTGQYPRQSEGEVSGWRRTFFALRKKRLLVRCWDHTHWSWSLHRRGFDVVHRWLVQARRSRLST
jgi:hypothetical protein